MVNPQSLTDELLYGSDDKSKIEYEDTWNWWNTFRTTADFSCKLSIALEMSADIPSKLELSRWKGEKIISLWFEWTNENFDFDCQSSGEPVGCLIIPSQLFINNNNNYPVLTRAHQNLILSFKETINSMAVMVKCNSEDGRIRYYSDYLRNLLSKNPITDPMYG